jgi:glutathione S-transferase
MIKLYFSDGSPYARKVRIVLAEKGIAYEHDRQDIVRPVEVIRGLNPNLTIPVLKDGRLRLFDSKVIVEYLLQTYPQSQSPDVGRPFYNAPTRPAHHWEDRKTLTTLETLAESIVNIRMMQASGVEIGKVEYLQRQLTRIGAILDWLNLRASPDGFMPGFFSMLDIELVCAVQYAESRAIASWRGRPNLDALVDGLAARPSVATTYPAPLPA